MMYELIVDLDSIADVYASDSGKKLYNTIKSIMNENTEVDIKVLVLSSKPHNSDGVTSKLINFTDMLIGLDVTISNQRNEDLYSYISGLSDDASIHRIYLSSGVQCTEILTVEQGNLSYLLMIDVISSWVSRKLNNFILKGER